MGLSITSFNDLAVATSQDEKVQEIEICPFTPPFPISKMDSYGIKTITAKAPNSALPNSGKAWNGQNPAS